MASPGLGEIRLIIDKVISLGRSNRVRKPVALSHKVHERSKKGIVHGTRLVLKLHALESHIMSLALGMKLK